VTIRGVIATAIARQDNRQQSVLEERYLRATLIPSTLVAAGLATSTERVCAAGVEFLWNYRHPLSAENAPPHDKPRTKRRPIHRKYKLFQRVPSEVGKGCIFERKWLYFRQSSLRMLRGSNAPASDREAALRERFSPGQDELKKR
jgi:hypothetical protein